ncbi:dynamin family protein [Escherichia coli]|nr:dynamin family protein [Escherichia coli]
MHEKNIALLCDEADRLLQLNINLLRQMVEEPDVLSDSKNENRLLFDKQKALKRIEELEGEQIKTARREMVLAVVGTMKAGKSTTINAIVGQEILPNRNRPMTSVPTLIRHVPGKTEPVLHLEHIQPVRNLLITLQEKLATPAGQQVAQTLQQTGDTRELLDILTDDGWLKNEYHGEEEIFTGLASLNDLVRLAAASGKRKEQQMLEEEDAEQRRSQSGLWGKISQWSGINNQGREDYRKRDFAPDSPEIKFSDRREALELMTQIESTVTSLHREAEAQFRPELEKIVSGIETGFRGTALYATENIAGRINARLEDEGFTVKISFPAVSQLQTRLAVKINLSALMEERTETVTRRRRQSGVWGTVCRWFGTSDLGWENYDEDVSRSVININKVREEVMSLTRAYFGELQASIEQDINQPVRQEIDAFFCAFREKVEQLRNTLIQSSEDHKRDQQAQERLTGRLQALNERVPELITDSKALREELETML